MHTQKFVISVSDADIQFQHDAISRQVYIYYSVHAIQAEIIITVTIKDQRTQKNRHDYIVVSTT